MACVFIRKQQEDTGTHKEKTPLSYDDGAETKMSKEHWGHQGLEETRKNPLLEASEEHGHAHTLTLGF